MSKRRADFDAIDLPSSQKVKFDHIDDKMPLTSREIEELNDIAPLNIALKLINNDQYNSSYNAILRTEFKTLFSKKIEARTENFKQALKGIRNECKVQEKIIEITLECINQNNGNKEDKYSEFVISKEASSELISGNLELFYENMENAVQERCNISDEKLDQYFDKFFDFELSHEIVHEVKIAYPEVLKNVTEEYFKEKEESSDSESESDSVNNNLDEFMSNNICRFDREDSDMSDTTGDTEPFISGDEGKSSNEL